MNQVLTQDEINALLRGLSDSDVEADTFQNTQEEGIRKYDLASQERIIRGRMPTMELIHDRFSRAFRTALSKFLGRTCFINVGGIEIVKFGLFMKKLPLPSSLHIYRMPPLQGYALLAVSTPLVFGMVDSLFGGKGIGKVKIEGREYTAIETRLIGKVVMMALEILKDAWAPIHPVDFVYVRSEFNPLAIAIVPPTDVVIIVTVEVELEQESTTLTLCTPYSTIEPIRQKLTTGFQSNRLEIDSHVIQRMASNIKKTQVEMSVQLANGQIKTREALNLSVGDIIPLATNPTEEAIVQIERTPKYKGFVGSFRANRAVKITEAIYPEEEVS
ncbi:MAG TPA: flagellar motor switch protein FliM [Oligoflexia bacterium]|nr:flagellar motor switch protein FliM [Oligoflexia bacterium]HMP48775.1 flagellar motor switch protein FliM [Oligoflexia bacterium]